MKLRCAVLSLGFVVLAASPAVAGTDDQKKEQVIAKPSAQDGFRFCNLTGQPVEVAKATYSATRPASEAFVSEGWYQFEPGQCQVLWVGKLQYRYYLVYAQNKSAGRDWTATFRSAWAAKPSRSNRQSAGPTSINAALMRHFLRHAGLMRPYRFERTLVVLAGLALALMVGTAAVILAAHNHLLLDSPRGWHFFIWLR